MELSLPQRPVASRRPPPSATHTPPPFPISQDAAPTPLPARPDGGSHVIGFGVVVAVHVVVGYALLSGLAQKVVDAVRPPVEVRLIQEIKPPPPPPPAPPKQVVKAAPRVAPPPPPAYVPPPQVEGAAPPAPVITAVTQAPPAPPPPAPAPVVAAAAPAARPAEPVAIGVVCPTMVKPTLPRRAEEEGIGGSVRAQATIRGGKVVAVEILNSRPRGLFDSAVRNAMLQYQCNTSGESTGGDEIVAVQNFQFRAAE